MAQVLFCIKNDNPNYFRSIETFSLKIFITSLTSLYLADGVHGQKIVEIRLFRHLIKAYDFVDVANPESLVLEQNSKKGE